MTRNIIICCFTIFSFLLSSCKNSNSINQFNEYNKLTFKKDMNSLVKSNQVDELIFYSLLDFHFLEEKRFDKLKFYTKIINEMNLRFPNAGSWSESVKEGEDYKIKVQKIIQNGKMHFDISYLNRRKFIPDSIAIELKLFTFQNELSFTRYTEFPLNKDTFNFKLYINDPNDVFPAYYTNARKEFQLNEIGMEKLLKYSKFLISAIEVKDNSITEFNNRRQN